MAEREPLRRALNCVTFSVTGGCDDCRGFTIVQGPFEPHRADRIFAIRVNLGGHLTDTAKAGRVGEVFRSRLTSNATRDGASHTFLDGRQTIARTTKLEYVPHSRSGHCTGTPGPFDSSQDGLPIPAACDEAPWPPRRRSSKTSNGRCCARLFLAPTLAVQVRLHTKEQPRVLDDEVQRQCCARPPDDGRTQGTRLARYHRLGM
jgi:hypothetical protein